MKKIFLIAVFICSSAVVFGQNKSTKVDEATTLAVFQHHSKALGENNIDEIYSSVAELSNSQINKLIDFADNNLKVVKFIPDNKEVFSKKLKLKTDFNQNQQNQINTQ